VAITVSEREATAGVGVGVARESMDTVLNFSRHGELCPVSTVKPLSRHETVEIISALLVASGAESESANGTGLHDVAMFLMGLDVLSVLDTAVFSVVNLKTSDDGTWAEILGHAKPVREGVDPEDTQEDHFDNHPGMEFFKRHHVVGTTSVFFGGADASCDVSDVFVFPTDIRFRVQVGGDGAR
jgi:hypothetical protein